MKIRRRKRPRGMTLSMNQCFICKEIKVCVYELINVQKDPVCEDCVMDVKKQREEKLT